MSLPQLVWYQLLNYICQSQFGHGIGYFWPFHTSLEGSLILVFHTNHRPVSYTNMGLYRLVRGPLMSYPKPKPPSSFQECPTLEPYPTHILSTLVKMCIKIIVVSWQLQHILNYFFRNAQIFNNYFLKRRIFCEGKWRIFWNSLEYFYFFQMKIFKITELFGRHVLKPPSIYCDIS
jgi:hypothetical protein